MIPVLGEYKHNPEKGVYGDCYRACVASLLELPLSEVPHFLFDNPDREVFHERIRAWLKSKELQVIEIAFPPELKDLFRMMKRINPGVYYMLGGKSESGWGHSTVCFEDQFVHDPSGTIIVAPDTEGHYWVSVFGDFNPFKKQILESHCYHNRPNIVKAQQFIDPNNLPPGVSCHQDCGYYVTTIHGQQTEVLIGDWIVLEPDGIHYYPVKDAIFKARYNV